jgi:hypothetical protein
MNKILLQKVSLFDTFLNNRKAYKLGNIDIFMNINKIYEALLNRKEKVCNKPEIFDLIREYNKRFRLKIKPENALKYLARHNYLKRIFLSFYYINSNDERKRNFSIYEDRELLFGVLNKLGIKWYIGLSSALYVEGKSWQLPAKISIINNKFSGTRKILSLKVKFYKIKENLIFSLKKAKTKNNVSFFYSESAKTHLDMVYFRISNKLIQDKNTKKYLKRFPKWVGKK